MSRHDGKPTCKNWFLTVLLLGIVLISVLGISLFSFDRAYATPELGSDCSSCHDDMVPASEEATETTPEPKTSAGVKEEPTEPIKTEPETPKVLGNDACITCHGQEGFKAAEFESSVHGKLQCVTCHENAKVFPHESTGSDEISASTKAAQNEKCASCHQGNVLNSYNRSFHGIAVANGYEKAASCTDCHGGAHSILPASNPTSMISEANLANTCDSCHPGMAAAGANITNGKEHVIPEDKEGAFPLWITWKVFLALILFDIVMNGTIPTLELLKLLRGVIRPIKPDLDTPNKDVTF